MQSLQCRDLRAKIFGRTAGKEPFRPSVYSRASLHSRAGQHIPGTLRSLHPGLVWLGHRSCQQSTCPPKQRQRSQGSCLGMLAPWPNNLVPSWQPVWDDGGSPPRPATPVVAQTAAATNSRSIVTDSRFIADCELRPASSGP